MKSENILKVIEVFKKVLPMANRKNHLNMMEDCVNVAHECGTIHCHAGWFAVGACNLSNHIYYEEGAFAMSKMLDFSDRHDLKDWAFDNIELWGNESGYSMFSDPIAFSHPTRRPNGAENLQHIIDHWTEVYERVKATEQPQQPAYENISKSLAVLPVSETSDVINQIVKI